MVPVQCLFVLAEWFACAGGAGSIGPAICAIRSGGARSAQHHRQRFLCQSCGSDWPECPVQWSGSPASRQLQGCQVRSRRHRLPFALLWQMDVVEEKSDLATGTVSVLLCVRHVCSHSLPATLKSDRPAGSVHGSLFCSIAVYLLDLIVRLPGLGLITSL